MVSFKHRRRPAAGALCAFAVAAAGCEPEPSPSPAGPNSSAAARPGGAAAGAPAGQRLRFGLCENEALNEAGARCATLTVPLDHADPGGRTIEVQISRIEADPARRLGVLVFNPGGPGSPGLDFPAFLRPALGDVAERYDLIGFDPRFVGGSSPISCGPTRFTDTFRSSGEDYAGFQESVGLSADFAERCHAAHADVLPYAGTRDVAHDVDAIRAALGERQISFYGVSWGANLGATYSQLYPDRVDRMVLDSSGDGAARDRLRAQAAPAEAALDEWADWAARRHGEYGLGRTASEVRAAVEGLIEHAARRPVVIEGHRLDDNTLPLLVMRWLNHEDDDPGLARAVRDLIDAAAGRPVTPSDELLAQLSLWDAESPVLDNLLAAAWANFCGEGGWPSAPSRYWRDVQRSRRLYPVFGPLANNIRPCASWAVASPEPPLAIGNDVPMLMVHAERDNATPLEGGLRLHEKLVGSRLVTGNVRAHGVYGRGTEGRRPVPCVDRVVNDYLRDGTLPPRDGNCE